MANIITAGNSTNGGTAISTDTSGTLNIVTGSGSGITAMSIDASGNVSGVIKSSTAVASTSGTSIDFTGIPSTAKRITVMFNGVSISGTSSPLIQIGSGSVTNSGYVSSASISTTTTAASSTAGFVASFGSGGATFTVSGNVVLTLISSNTWVASGILANTATFIFTTSFGGVSPNLAGALDRVRITTVNGTDTFDAGSINILYE